MESKRFITDAVKSDKPFFVWHNTTRMHYRTILNDKYKDKSGYGVYADGMMELDDCVGELLDLIKKLGVDDNTIVMFSTDNGAPCNSWPDGGNQPFHGEKARCLGGQLPRAYACEVEKQDPRGHLYGRIHDHGGLGCPR